MQNQIPNNWQKVKLGEIAIVNMGQSPSSKYYNFNSNGMPFYQGVTDFGEKYPSPNMHCTQPIKIAEPGTALFSVRAPVGEVNIAKEESCIGRGVASLKMINGNNNFLYFLLKANFKYLRSISGGTTYESINKDQIENIEIYSPNSLAEQQKIASILSSFDDKIELNNKINKILEEMASAIFKEWFIKPTNGEKLIVKNGAIKDIAYVKTGNRPGKLTGKKENAFTIPVYGAKEIMGYTNKLLYYQQIIITGRVGTIGEVTIVNEPSWPSDNALILIPKDYNYFYFLYFLAKKINYLSLNRGSSQPLIAQSDIENYAINLPDKNLIIKFNLTASKLFLLKENKEIENQKLAVMRDLLLPKLMKGEIRI